MNRSHANDPELADFLRKVRRGEPPVRSRRCGSALVRSNSLACTEEQADELMELAQRPPPGMVLYKFGSRSVVGRHELSDGAPVVLKYYFPKGIGKNLSHGIMGSRCMRSWDSALAFQHLGLPVPPAMLVAEWKALGGLWSVKSFLATGVAPGVPLPQWLDAHADDGGRLDAMAGRLRHCFSLMARHRVSHGDLKGTNIIVAADDSIRFVDLDGVRFSDGGRRWQKAHGRDRRIFLGNWQPGSVAAAAFSRVFPDTESHD
jgi:tRNA A-37 threonylcarbamoyl transferase component Bud32